MLESDGAARTVRVRRAGHVLIWQRGAVTILIEGTRTLGRGGRGGSLPALSILVVAPLSILVAARIEELLFVADQADPAPVAEHAAGRNQPRRNASRSRSSAFCSPSPQRSSASAAVIEIDGWYRRGLRPYVEMVKLTTDTGIVHRAYSRWVQLGLAAAAVGIGWMWLTSVT